MRPRRRPPTSEAPYARRIARPIAHVKHGITSRLLGWRAGAIAMRATCGPGHARQGGQLDHRRHAASQRGRISHRDRPRRGQPRGAREPPRHVARVRPGRKYGGRAVPPRDDLAGVRRAGQPLCEPAAVARRAQGRQGGPSPLQLHRVAAAVLWHPQDRRRRGAA